MTKVKSRILINLAYSQRLQYTALKVIYILLVCIFSGYIFAFLVLKMWELSCKLFPAMAALLWLNDGNGLEGQKQGDHSKTKENQKDDAVKWPVDRKFESAGSKSGKNLPADQLASKISSQDPGTQTKPNGKQSRFELWKNQVTGTQAKGFLQRKLIAASFDQQPHKQK